MSKENNFNYGGVFLITGESGIGKSFIAKVICLKLKAEFCNHFKLCEAGNNIDTLIKNSQPTEEKPLILLIDEIDKSIETIRDNKCEKHKYLTTPTVCFKTFLDFMEILHDYDNLFVIFTTNVSYDWFNKINPALMRPGRINGVFDMTTNSYTFNNLLSYSYIKGTNNSLAIQANKMRFKEKVKGD